MISLIALALVGAFTAVSGAINGAFTKARNAVGT